ncbi:MAG: DNA-binding protein [Candidatus Thermoplasmatota archaeon]|nr:DNA-binding protein [Candidatus Thermoplasmatota archaeon]
MQVISEGKFTVARLEDGEKIIPSILDIAESQDIYCGIILSGIGMLRETTLNYFDGQRYVETQYPKPMELLSLKGSIASDSSVHVHASMADRCNRVYGGHLSGAVAHYIVELTLLNLETVHMTRKKNPNTGLMEMRLEKREGPVTIRMEEDEDD